MAIEEVSKGAEAWLVKLRFSIADPSYTGPSSEQLVERIGLSEIPTAYDINRMLELYCGRDVKPHKW